MALDLTTEQDYHSREANRRYMSVHQFQNWCQELGGCPAAEYAYQAGEYIYPDKDCFVTGRYAHVKLFEPEKLAAFCAENADRLFSRPTWKDLGIDRAPKGVTLDDWMAEHPEDARKGKPYAGVKDCDALVDALKEQPIIQALLSEGEAEHAVGPVEFLGCEWRGRIDWIRPKDHVFCDLKSAANFEPKGGFGDSREVLWFDRYWLQMAVYRELLHRVYGGDWTPIIFGATKQKEGGTAYENTPNVDIVSLDPRFAVVKNRLASEIAFVAENLPAVLRMKAGEQKSVRCARYHECEYCRKTKVLTPEDAISKWRNTTHDYASFNTAELHGLDGDTERTEEDA